MKLHVREISKVISVDIEGKKFLKRRQNDVLLVLLFWLGPLEFKILKFLFFCCLNIFLGNFPRLSVHKSLKTKANSQLVRTPVFLVYILQKAKANNQSVTYKNSLNNDVIFFVSYFTVGDWGFFCSEPPLAYPVQRSHSWLNFQMQPVFRWTVFWLHSFVGKSKGTLLVVKTWRGIQLRETRTLVP